MDKGKNDRGKSVEKIKKEELDKLNSRNPKLKDDNKSMPRKK